MRKRSVDGPSRRAGLLAAFMRRSRRTGDTSAAAAAAVPQGAAGPHAADCGLPTEAVETVDVTDGATASRYAAASGRHASSGARAAIPPAPLPDASPVPTGNPTGHPACDPADLPPGDPAGDPSAAPRPAVEPARRPRGPQAVVLPDWTHLPSMEVRVDLTGVERRRARQATRKALLWHGRFVIVHTGNIGIRQGLEELSGALRRMAEVQPDVLVSFIGNGNRRPALVAATAGLPNVEIRDPVPPDQLFAVLLASDLLLVSERSDGADITVPSKLTAYFAAARPVLAVVSQGSATAAEVQCSGSGVLVAPGDPLSFTAAVAMLRGDPAERARLGDSGLRHVAAEALSRIT